VARREAVRWGGALLALVLALVVAVRPLPAPDQPSPTVQGSPAVAAIGAAALPAASDRQRLPRLDGVRGQGQLAASNPAAAVTAWSYRTGSWWRPVSSTGSPLATAIGRAAWGRAPPRTAHA
jgi:hypothetical protein